MKTSRDLQMFAAVTHLVEEQSLDTFLTSKVETFLISLVDTRRPTTTVSFVLESDNE
jgi:hypothetical protein